MSDLVLILRWAGLVWGLCYLVCSSSAFGWFRGGVVGVADVVPALLPLVELVYCPPCMGFWVGLYLGLVGGWPVPAITFGPVESAICAAALMAASGKRMPVPADLQQLRAEAELASREP